MQSRAYRIAAAFLVLVLTLSLLPLSASAAASWEDLSQPLELTLNGFDIECRTGFTVVYTEAGKNTGTGENCVDVAVDADGIVLSVGEHDTVVPEGGFVLSGGGPARTRVLKNLQPGDGVYLSKNGEKGKVVLVTKEYQPFRETTISYTGMNRTRNADTIMVYNIGSSTKTNVWGYEVSVDANGSVISLGGNDSPIPEGGFVLSGHGTGRTTLENAASIGMTVVLNTDEMTATFRLDAAAFLRAFELRKENAQKSVEDAKASYRVFDESAAEELLKSMDSICSSLKGAADSGDSIRLFLGEQRFTDAESDLGWALTEETPAEMRAVWLRPELSASTDKAYETVKQVYDAGFNQIYIEILFDNTLIYPPKEGSLYEQNPKLAGFDLLQAYIDACHAYRIELHAWYSVLRAGYTGSSNTARGVAAKKPEWRTVQKNGNDTVTNSYGISYFLNPALPEVREFLTEHVKDLVSRYPLDGVHLDYIRYPSNASGEDFGYDELTKSQFKEKYGREPVAGTTDFIQFRADFVTELVRSIRTAVKEIRPDVWLSAAVAPNYESSLKTHQQDTRTWIREHLIDIVMPMAYGTNAVVESNTADNAALLKDDLALYLLPGVSDNGAEAFMEQAQTVRTNGGDGVAFFSWASYTGDYLSASEKLFPTKTCPPTWDTKAAINSAIALMKKRLDGPLKDVVSGTLKQAVNSLQTKLENSSVSSASAELNALFDAFDNEKSSLPEKAAEALQKDVDALKKMDHLCRDDAKQAYLTDHPLPESRIEPEEQESKTPEGETSEETSGDTKTIVELNGFEKVMQVIAMVILIGGILLLPLYYFLNRRRKKIIKSFEENGGRTDEPGAGDETPTDDPEPPTAGEGTPPEEQA